MDERTVAAAERLVAKWAGPWQTADIAAVAAWLGDIAAVAAEVGFGLAPTAEIWGLDRAALRDLAAGYKARQNRSAGARALKRKYGVAAARRITGRSIQ